MVVRPTGNTITPVSTPLHVYKLVYLVLQDVFRSQDPDKWPFTLTDDFETTQVGFDTVYNKASDYYGKKPLIVVSRGPQSTAPLAIADRGATNMQTMNTLGSTVVRSSVEIKVVSKEPEEADIIGQHIFNVLQFSRVTLAQVLGLVSVEGVSMSHVAPIDQEDHMFFVSISMGYQLQYMWSQFVPQNILNSIALTMNSVKTFE